MSKTNLLTRPLACTALAATLFGTAAVALPRYSDWTAPASAEALPGSSPALNTAAVDGCVSLTRDGRTIYFNSNRGGNQDLYRATRETVADGFGNPDKLPAPVNTAADEFCPTIAAGGRLYFSRASASDPGDLMVARERQGGDWDEPVTLGAGINSPLMDEAADFFEDAAGNAVMVFSRRQANGLGGKLFQSVNGGAAALMGGGVASAGSDNRPSVTRNGLTVYFDSTRPGGKGGPDLYVATRESTEKDFGPATALSALNSPAFDARAAISFDESELFFSSSRTGSESALPDIWRTARERAAPGPKVVTF